MRTMNIEINTATVIGAGAMGSGIAAHLANAGVEKVYLLDIVPKDADDRNVIAKSAIQRMLKATPATDPLSAGFMIPENAERLIPGNVENHLEQAAGESDWIVEVVLEDLAVKQELFEKLDALKKPDAIVSSNTSTIPLHDLVADRSDEFKRHFLITHFFNPPRFMRLLEVVGGPDTDPAVMDAICEFGDQRLGKNVIRCKDTPAFIANRIGIYYMFRAIVETVTRSAKIEEVDAVLGRPMGFPKDGIFGLLDLVGIGIIPHVADSLLKTLPEDDAFRKLDHQQGLAPINTLLADGRTGRKSPKGGFYRMQKLDGGKKQKQAVDLNTGEYYNVDRPELPGVKAAKKHGPLAVFEAGDAIGDLAWVVVRDMLLYAASLVPEIADDIADVDAGLRDGYNAKWGPFELIDELGAEWFVRRVQSDGIELPPTLKLAGGRPFYTEHHGRRVRLVFDFENNRADYAPLPAREGVLRLSGIKRNAKPLLSHYSASLWDIGDGVACLEFTSKMNTLDPSVLWMVNQSVNFIGKTPNYKALVIYNEAKNFSLGANLGLIQAGLKTKTLAGIVYGAVDAMIFQGQSVFKALRDAPFPVVGAPNGMALGGGCEILLHCNALQAGAETYMGLVESGVGLIPAWGGCARYLERCQDAPGMKGGPVPPARQAFETIMMPQFSSSTSAADARKKLWLRPEDGITMNPERLLADAKARALAMAENYTPPEPAVYRLPGPPAAAMLNMAIDDFYRKGDATWHDAVVADALASVVTGGETDVGRPLADSDIAQLEREYFLSLLKTPQTRKRIAHTLKTGKPLREGKREDGKPLSELRAERRLLYKPLSQRRVTGRPLRGLDAIRLRLMAKITALLLKCFRG